MSATADPTVSQASAHLYEALSRHAGNLDLSATDPLVRAISEYGQANREHDDEKVQRASKHVWEELSKHRITMDLGAQDPVVRALSEYGEACKREGVKPGK